MVTHSDLGNEIPFRYRELYSMMKQDTESNLSDENIIVKFNTKIAHLTRNSPIDCDEVQSRQSQIIIHIYIS